MIKVYFVRHAQSQHPWEDDRTRPLTTEGIEDSKNILEFFKDKDIYRFYCSPYKRSIDTIRETAEYFGKEIIMDERLRERKNGAYGNEYGLFQKRWGDLNFHEEGGESIGEVQKRNVEALRDILSDCRNTCKGDKDINIVIGTHGTALSSILNYFDTSFNCDSFLRIIDWMPYVIELDFEEDKLIHTIEHLHVHKEFKGKDRLDKAQEGLKVAFYDNIEDEKLKFAVIVSKTQGKWVFCKHRERNTYEVPGGKREAHEEIFETAKRELREETGAIDFDIKPVCVYSVVKKGSAGEILEDESFGMLYFANIKSFEGELHSEMEKILITEKLPEKWTYPLIQPKLLEKIEETGYSEIK